VPALLAGDVVSRVLVPCGTDTAYQRHHRRREQVCEPCRLAHLAKMREWRQRAGINDAQRAESAARGRAKSRLAAEYPARFAALYVEELARGQAGDAS